MGATTEFGDYFLAAEDETAGGSITVLDALGDAFGEAHETGRTGLAELGETLRAGIATTGETVRTIVGTPAAVADSAAEAAAAPFVALKWGAVGLAAVVGIDLVANKGRTVSGLFGR